MTQGSTGLLTGAYVAETAAPPGPAVADPAVNTSLPASGPGFYCKTPGKQYGRRDTIRALTAIAAEWHRRHPTGPRIGINDISLPGGGPMPPHSTHRNGRDVDIRPVRGDGKEEAVSYTDAPYSRQLTQELVDLILANPVLKVSRVFFNDPQVRGVRPLAGHHNHLHVTFTDEPAPGATPPPTSYVPLPAAPAVPAVPRAPATPAAPAEPPPPGAPAEPTGVRLGSLVTTLPGGRRFAYRFTPVDLLWTGRFLVGESGGRGGADDRAVIWTMLNLYGLIRHQQYPTFHAFLRAYSTPLQSELRNAGAARRHQANPDFVRTRPGRTYPPPARPGIAVGQLGRFLKLQRTPWAALPPAARALAAEALAGRAPNPVGAATQFANTAVYYRDRHGRLPDEAAWRRFTQELARSRRWRWIGPRPGLNQRGNNAFFEEDRFAQLPRPVVRVLPPGR